MKCKVIEATHHGYIKSIATLFEEMWSNSFLQTKYNYCKKKKEKKTISYNFIIIILFTIFYLIGTVP